MRRFLQTMIVLVFALAIVASSVQADVRLAGIFGDHMVLQRQKEIKIWGWADAGQNLTVEMDGAMANAKANEEGKWAVTLPAKQAGGPYELSVRTKKDGDPDVLVKDILMGEVWLCSGQSNMEWTVSRSENAAAEIAAADFPNIRHWKAAHRPSNTAINDVRANWRLCSPKTVGGFTAAGYFFGRKLHRELNVPIGLVHSSWGGTRIEPWTPPVGFESVPALKPVFDKLQMGTIGTPEYNAAMSQHLAATEKWLGTAQEKFGSGQSVATSVPFPAGLVSVKKSRQSPAHLYNGMIHGIVGFPIRGAIWYQGESNRYDGMAYFEKKKALIQGWRKIWGQGDFPFYFVQLAPYSYNDDDPNVLPRIWEAQSKSLEIPNTGMAVINDIGNLKNIHPTKKQEVGRRLALIALKNDYGQDDLVASGPTFESFAVEGGKLIVTMANIGDGIKSRDGNQLDWFEIAGEGAPGFETASVEIDGNKLILSSSKISNPTAMRFAWGKIAVPNLVNSEGLPASSFRAGKVNTEKK